MKKALLLSLCLLAAAGCLNINNTSGLEKDVYPVVESYLENAAAGNWQEVYGALTGEALSGARANAGQVKSAGEKIISKKFKVTRSGEGLAKVNADFTKSTVEGFDRLAYSFDLIRYGDRWLIYKTVWGKYLHGDLNPGQLPADAAGAIRAYLEMPYADKKARDHLYLAGKLLQDSEKSKALTVDAKIYGVLQKTATTVTALECLGLSDDYAVVKAACSVERDGVAKETSLLIDAVLVNGTWKIAGIEIL